MKKDTWLYLCAQRYCSLTNLVAQEVTDMKCATELLYVKIIIIQ